MSNLQELLQQLQKPTEPNNKIRLTFGFYDLQSNYFQSCIPSEILSKIVKDSQHLKGIRNYLPFVQELSNFQKFCRVSPTMWDVRIDYVLSDQQAVFLHQDTNLFQVIVAEENIHKMLPIIHTILTSNSEVYEQVLTCPLYFCLV
jgi:hypothetical protein